MVITYMMMLSVTAMVGEGFNLTNTESSEDPSNVCRTSGCLKAAEEIVSSLDQNVDPCDDFYQFSCGGWMEKHPMVGPRPGVFIAFEMQDEMDNKIKDLLATEVTGSDPDYARKAKQIYQSCMDLGSIEAMSGDPLNRTLEALGGWPVVKGGSWEGENFDWIDTLIRMRNMGYDHNILFKLSVLPDDLNSTLPILTLGQNLYMFDREFLLSGLEDNVTRVYYRQMVQMAEILGAYHDDAETQMMDALNFEITLAKYLVPNEERQNVSEEYNRCTVRTLQENIPQINWMKYFNGLLMDPISEEETIAIVDYNFVFKLADLINQTDKRVLANYMLGRVAQQALPGLSKEWQSLEQQYYTALYDGYDQEHPRDDTCMGLLVEYMSIALSAYFVRNYFQEESKERASEILDYIQKEYVNTFDTIQWMPQETKTSAKEKVNAMKKFVGYPDELLNDTVVSDLYKNLIVTNGSFYDNLMELRKWEIEENLSQLRRPYLKEGWKNHAKVDRVKSEYDQFENSIALPSALLQNPLFDKNRPQYRNFGGIGFIIGSLMSRGFHDEVMQFKTKTDCLIEQYSNYTSDHGLKVDGVVTLDANMHNNAGLKEAYKAYQTWVKDHGTEGLLPELNYSPNQLFWISAASSRCAKFQASAEEQIMSENHLPPFKFSINGPLSNFPEFANDFQCEPNSNMNPQNRCQILE